MADIHDRQKWSMIWPLLAALPDTGLRILDAGCGDGSWALEMASRRPGWTLVGVDRDGGAIAVAEASRRTLSLHNVSFAQSDFLAYDPPGSFDVVLSVSSAHYLVEQGKGVELFGRFDSWMAPGGLLILLGPRAAHECRFVPALHRPAGHSVFSAADLADLCQRNSLEVVRLEGRVGPLGVLAKQLSWEFQFRSVWLGRFILPVLWTFSTLDRLLPSPDSRRTIMWLLSAHAAAPHDGKGAPV